ncbi:hypothetical protein KAH94_06155 [bacterium]|nr:hypothetical protein [bacterium]
MYFLMDDRTLPPPVDCDECPRGVHPSGIFKKKDGKNLCILCIKEKIIGWKSNNNIDNYGPLLEDILTEEEYNRFLLTYGELGDEKLFH